MKGLDAIKSALKAHEGVYSTVPLLLHNLRVNLLCIQLYEL